MFVISLLLNDCSQTGLFLSLSSLCFQNCLHLTLPCQGVEIRKKQAYFKMFENCLVLHQGILCDYNAVPTAAAEGEHNLNSMQEACGWAQLVPLTTATTPCGLNVTGMQGPRTMGQLPFSSSKMFSCVLN